MSPISTDRPDLAAAGLRWLVAQAPVHPAVDDGESPIHVGVKRETVQMFVLDKEPTI